MEDYTSMFDDPESRFNVLKKWLALTEFRGIDDTILSDLVESGTISRPSDLYKLTSRHLMYNQSIDFDNVHAILDSVEKCRDVGMARAMVALLEELPIEQIRDIASVPCPIPELVDRFPEHVDKDAIVEELDRLMQVGVNLDFSSNDTIFDMLLSTPLTGKVIAVSGILSAEHDVVKDTLESFGAKPTEKVTKDTDMLLAGEGAGEDMELALKIGVQIVSELEVARMLGMEI